MICLCRNLNCFFESNSLEENLKQQLSSLLSVPSNADVMGKLTVYLHKYFICVTLYSSTDYNSTYIYVCI